jgi:hypothetical protein
VPRQLKSCFVVCTCYLAGTRQVAVRFVSTGDNKAKRKKARSVGIRDAVGIAVRLLKMAIMCGPTETYKSLLTRKALFPLSVNIQRPVVALSTPLCTFNLALWVLPIPKHGRAPSRLSPRPAPRRPCSTTRPSQATRSS